MEASSADIDRPRCRVGVFGGTFDPVHIGHLIAADTIRYKLALDEVRFLPARRPPHKPDRHLAPDEHRLEMLRIAIAGTPYFTISTIDYDRAGPSYTADSLERLRRDDPDIDELYFMMGSDSLRDLPIWHEPHRIVASARIAVARRPGVDVSLDAVYAAIPEAVGRIELVDIPLIDVSSSDIREAVATGGPYRYLVLPQVAEYIERHGLYASDRSSAPS